MPPASWAPLRGDPPQVVTAPGAKAQACPATPHLPRQEDEWSPSAQRNRPREGEQRAEGTRGWVTGPWGGGESGWAQVPQQGCKLPLSCRPYKTVA